jgi:hypothetical protein
MWLENKTGKMGRIRIVIQKMKNRRISCTIIQLT